MRLATGVDKDTLVLFTSDNGPWFQGSPGRLRGRKGMTWEGGVREPFLARWPGHIPPGKVCTGLASMMDILPTVAALAGAARPDNALDGIDIWPMLSGRKNELDRDVLLYFDDENVQCARLGNWKLHFSRYNNATWSPPPAGGRKNITLAKPELYDLANDPDESYDVAAEHPDVVAKMQGRVVALIPGFPEEVRRAWTDTLSRQSGDTR